MKQFPPSITALLANSDPFSIRIEPDRTPSLPLGGLICSPNKGWEHENDIHVKPRAISGC